jgi:hypothetical protein
VTIILLLLFFSFAPTQDSWLKVILYNTLDVAVNVSTLNSRGEDIYVKNVPAGNHGELRGFDKQRFNIWHSQTQLLLGSFSISPQREAFTLRPGSLNAGRPNGPRADVVVILAVGIVWHSSV